MLDYLTITQADLLGYSMGGGVAMEVAIRHPAKVTAMPTASGWTTSRRCSASKGGEIHGDLRPRSESRLAVLPNASHGTLMEKGHVIIPMVNDFLDATSQKP